MLKRITNNRIPKNLTLDKVYDEIRMRDEDGHPLAYINYGGYRLEFRRASLRKNCVEADVRVYAEKQKDNDGSGTSR